MLQSHCWIPGQDEHTRRDVIMSQGKYPSLRNLLRICADRSRPVAGAWSGVRCSQSGVRCYQSVRGPVLSCRFGAIRPVRCYQSGPVLSVRGSVLSGRFGVISQVRCSQSEVWCYQVGSVLSIRFSAIRPVRCSQSEVRFPAVVPPVPGHSRLEFRAHAASRAAPKPRLRLCGDPRGRL